MELTSLDWLDETVLGSNIIVRDLMIAGAILLLGVVLASFMPRMLANNIARIFSNIEYRSLKRSQKRGEYDQKINREKIDG